MPSQNMTGATCHHDGLCFMLKSDTPSPLFTYKT
jgi:hypothetical protein